MPNILECDHEGDHERDHNLALEFERRREDFPLLRRSVNGHSLVYFDNAATAHKPQQVLDTVQRFYNHYNSNIHRSQHTLGMEASDLYRQAHKNVGRFIRTAYEEEIIFVRSCTEAINMVAYAFLFAEKGRFRLEPGDEIVLTIMEHHSNIVPWQMVRDRKGIHLIWIDIDEDGSLDMEQLEASLSERTRMVCCTHVSNVLGTLNPIRRIGELAHQYGALFFVDGAQSLPHLSVDVRELGCDFLAFSGHKMLAPMGTGVLYGRRELLQEMDPFLLGGDMIETVTQEGATWNRLPEKLEAGTANVCGNVALGGAVDRSSGERLGGAVDYLNLCGMENIRAHELQLTELLLTGLMDLPEVHFYGPRMLDERSSVVAFNIEKDGEIVDCHSIAQLFNDMGIAVRAGGHCAYPLMKRLRLAGAVRVSFYLYNTSVEVDYFLDSLKEIIDHRLI